jgi:hypothetical protein
MPCIWLTVDVKPVFRKINYFIKRLSMTASALLTLLLSQGIVTAFTGYFLWKVLNSPERPSETHGEEQGSKNF